MRSGRLPMSLTITSTTPVGQFELFCRHVNMTGKLMLPPSASCVMLFAFFKHKVGLWKTNNAVVSCQTLRGLRKTILTSKVVLMHDNARPHNAVVTQQLLGQLKWEVSDHPVYSPDLATSDFHLFPELKNRLRGQSFQKNEP
ncbi:hypothetical protein AVEN_118916-1 [Araneus ventricosus]|uniref:Histone-lysine N-methyltransferase SETMAR n=1 Tax=Araneus ventricosus TaxID=182803 RepID=A0A4Y2BY92_ARAVE|nr:hypothetical protein AVEN_118916-1 [Araneus ventricosus]